MDPTPYLDVRPAPHGVFDHLEQRADRARFMVRDAAGDWHPVTWSAYADTIAKSAAALHTLGLTPGERVTVFAPNSIPWACAALGAQTAGGTMVPIYPGNTSEQAAFIIEHCDARFVFVDTPALLQRVLLAWEQLSGVTKVILLNDELDVEKERASLGSAAPGTTNVQERVLTWTEFLVRGEAALDANPELTQQLLRALTNQDIGLMLYTSGTTGNPKGVPLTYENVGSNGSDWINALHPLIADEPVDVLWLPLSHIFGFGELCLGNVMGFTTYWSNPKDALADLAEVAPNVFMSVPSYWEKLAQTVGEVPADERREKFREVTGGKLSLCLSGGAGLKKEIKETFRHHGSLIIEGYGLTECAPTLTLNRPDNFDFSTVGKPLESVQLKLAADGEILAKGPNVFSGYHNAPEATADAFTEDGWFKTGDIGRMTPEGFLQIIDRKKDILVTASGKNVPPANIEMMFRDDPLLEHVVVYGDGKKFLVAGVWVNESKLQDTLDQLDTSSGDPQSLTTELVQRSIETVNSSLARHETIKKFVIIDAPLTVENGFLTPSLKVKRKRVYEHFAPKLDALYA